MSGTGASREQVHDRRREFLDQPYPGGESWRGAIARVAGFSKICRCVGIENGSWIGHLATRWAFDEVSAGVPLASSLVEDLAWQPGWEYDAQ